MKGRVLFIDDEEQLRKLLTRIISLEEFNVTEAGSIKAALQILQRQSFDILLCDVRLPDGNGVDFVKIVRKDFPGMDIILLTAYGNIPDGIQAMKNGAFDYIVKGNDNDRIIPLLHQAMEQRKAAVKMSAGQTVSFNTIIGKTDAIKAAVKLAERVADTDATVLLLGETGTGKEVFANAIHQQSKRGKKSIIAINCSAFSRELLEAELFGYKAGAYTGANKDKKGLVEMAEGGTLFLDEVGELHIDLQAKLLRLLENGEYIKLGDSRISKANIRLVAATNRNLSRQVEEGFFRQDLYYRLNVFTIVLPTLRERSEDIPMLSQHFLAVFAARDNRQALQVSDTAMHLLQTYSWPGNIRELKNVLERAYVLVDEKEILPVHLPFEIQQQQSGNTGLSLATVEKHHIHKMLQYAGGNKTRAARLLGIGLATLYRKIEEYHIPTDSH